MALMNIPARLRALLLALLLGCTTAAFGAVPPWPDAPYSYFANNLKLETVLADFAAGFSLSLAIQPDVTGVVNGRFATPTPTEFMSKLAGVYGFVWYTHAGTLFVSRASDVVTRGIAAPGGNVAVMRRALADLGVLEARFGWGELGDHGLAMVSGPPSYVQLVENTIRNLPARAQQLRVFRLRHASANDRTVSYRDQQITTPGLATILRTIIGGGGPAPPASSLASGSSGTLLRPATPLGETGTATAAAAAPSSVAAPVTAAAQPASIQADPRLNALIIQDLPERMPLYEQMIAQLDVPTALVEIEAMILDISTERASELGVNWTGRVGKTSLAFGQQSATAGIGSIGFTSGATAAGNFLISQLQLLESKGDAEVQSRPSVLTSENLPALLDLSETFYIQSTGERVATVTPVTAGTTLRVTPHVLQLDGRTFVQLKIDIEDGNITDHQIGELPTISRSTVSTEATVAQGETLLIAGHASRRDITSKQQLPVLGEIPGLGLLFSSKTHTVQKRDRLFLIRPRVVGLLPQG
jgi:type III secretion protein C